MPIPDHLLPHYVPLVRKLALQLLAKLPASVELDDLLQTGSIGLLDAMRRYQESPGATFETYACARIRGAMVDELRNQDWLPRSARSKAKQIDQAIVNLERRLMRAPSESEIASELVLSMKDYRALLDDARGTQVLHYEDFGAAEEGDRDWLATTQANVTMAAPHAACTGTDPAQRILNGELRQALAHAIDSLPQREKLLLSLSCDQGLNLKEIGLVLGVTEARVCQLRVQATARIRAYLAQRNLHSLADHQAIADLI